MRPSARRRIWGGLGHNLAQFRQKLAAFEEMFDFATETGRAAIRGLNAARLYGFRG